jgi:protein-S-isoprenylcysteine O-methyltransferase Ste14
MKMIDKMLENGNWLFKYRGQLPIILFLIAIPIINNTSYYSEFEKTTTNIIQYIAIIISIIGLILRYLTIATTPSGTSGRNRNSQIATTLNTTGIYSITRNPLYFANYIIWLGISIYSLSYILTIITSLFFLFIYERIILVEENFLTKTHTKDYEEFIKKTPIFFPNFKNYKTSTEPFFLKKIFRQEYSSTLSTVISFIYIDLIIRYFNESADYVAIFTNKHLVILTISLVLGLILKTLKKLTK